MMNAVHITNHQISKNKTKQLYSLSYSLYDKAFQYPYSTEEDMKNNLSPKTNYHSKQSSSNRFSFMKRSRENSPLIHRDMSFNNKISFGERLYHKGIVMKNVSFEKTKTLQGKLLKKEMTHCTFKPKTLKVIGIEKYQDYLKQSNKNKKTSTRNYNTSTTSETNILMSQSLSSKLSNEKINSAKKQVKTNNSTRMNLAQVMKKIEPQKQELILHSIKLYNDGKKMKNRKQEIRNRYFRHYYPFKPIISKSQEKVPAKQVYQKDSMVNFFHRLQSWLENHEKTLQKNQEEELYDRDTGYRLYSPQINHISLTDNPRQMNHSNSTKSQHKWNELYFDAIKRRSKLIITESHSLKSITQISNSSFFSPRSKQIIDTLLRKIFNKLFELISPNGSYIDKNSILLEIIDAKVIEIFYPLLYQLEEQNMTLNEEQFYSSGIVLYNTFTILEKNILLEWYFSQCKREQYEREGKTKEFPFTFQSNSHKQTTLSGIKNNSLFMTRTNGNDRSHEKDKSFISKKDIGIITCLGGEVCTFRPNQYPTICNITPIDIDMHYSNNRIIEEI